MTAAFCISLISLGGLCVVLLQFFRQFTRHIFYGAMACNAAIGKYAQLHICDTHNSY